MSDLATAVAAFEALFDKVEHDLRAMDTTIVCSGALGVAGKPPPILCADEVLAVHFWKECATALYAQHKGHARTLIWRVRPEIQWYQMTMTGKTEVQRVVSNRCSVYSVLAFTDSEEAPTADEPTDETSGKPVEPTPA